MTSYVGSNSSDGFKHRVGWSHGPNGGANWPPRVARDDGKSSIKRRTSWMALIVAAGAVGGLTTTLAPRAHAAPAPEVEYLYDVAVRRHYNFPNNDPLGYGHGICDRVTAGESYAQVMGHVKSDVTPNDEFAANYLVSYSVNLLCPDQIWQLRKSATGYRPPGGVTPPDTYY